MAFVLTNDDGITAQGLAVLSLSAQLALPPETEVVLVAPTDEWSGCGHQITTNQKLHITAQTQDKCLAYAVSGTPADCTRVAVSHLLPHTRWVLSGINHGGNLGADVYVSGTVAAVREAAFQNISGIAFSQYRQGKRPIDWERSQRWATRVLKTILAFPYKPKTYWNVNFPSLEADEPEPKIVTCPLCTCPLPVAYQVEGNQLTYIGEYSKRDRTPNADVDVCLSGHISITKITL